MRPSCRFQRFVHRSRQYSRSSASTPSWPPWLSHGGRGGPSTAPGELFKSLERPARSRQLTIEMTSLQSLQRGDRHAKNENTLRFLPAGNVVSVGIDLADVSAVRDSIDHFGARYLDRIFTLGEQAQCAESSDPYPHLAARFAAKEATIKALMIDGPIPSWTSIEVQRQSAGYCRVHLTGSAARIAREKGIDALIVSLSHEADMAIAIVVATTRS